MYFASTCVKTYSALPPDVVEKSVPLSKKKIRITFIIVTLDEMSITNKHSLITIYEL